MPKTILHDSIRSKGDLQLAEVIKTDRTTQHILEQTKGLLGRELLAVRRLHKIYKIYTRDALEKLWVTRSKEY